MKERLLAYGEGSLLQILMKDETGNMRIDWLEDLFVKEKFPIDLGWKPRPIDLIPTVSGTFKLQHMTSKLRKQH